MKRKLAQNNPKDPSTIRTSFPGEIRSSQNQFNTANAGEPKTSEYAYFKKLKTDAGHRSHSSALDKEEIRSKLFGSGECSDVERSSGMKNSFKDLRLPAEDVTCVNPEIFLSPVVKVDLKRASTDFGNICSTRKSLQEPGGTQNQHEDLFSTKRKNLHKWVTDISFPEIEQLCSRGYDFVSVLLSRLFPDGNEEYSFKIPNSGKAESNIKSELLTSPYSTKEYSFKIPNSGKAESNIKSKLLSSPYSTSHLNKLHHKSARNFMEVECDPYVENGMSTCWLDTSRETALTNSESPTFYAHNTLLDFILREPSRELGGRRNTISWIENNSGFNSPSKNYGYLPSSHLKELVDFQYPDVSLLGKEKHPLLLGWNSQDVTNERTSAIISQNRELSNYPTPSTSWGNNYDPNLDDNFGPLGASGLCLSSVICKYHPNFYSLPPSPSTSYCKQERESNFTEDDKEDIVAAMSHYPLALSHMPNYFRPAEDVNHDTIYKGSRSLLSPGNQSWLLSKICGDWNHDPCTEAHIFSELDCYIGMECLCRKDSLSKHHSIDSALQFHQREDIFSHFLNEDKDANCLEFDGLSSIGVLNHIGKDMLDMCDWSSFYFQVSLNKQKACPLLLDKSRWDEIEGEIHHDDKEVEDI